MRPDVPREALEWGLILLVIPGPVVTYPFADSLWLVTDPVFRPPTLGDFRGHGKNLPTR